MPCPAAAAATDGRIHFRARFLGHPEAAIGESALDVLARPAERRELEVMDRGRAIQGEVRDHALRE